MNDVRKSPMPTHALSWRALLMGIVAASLSMLAAAAKPPAAKVPPPQASPVIRTLLAGGDARAVVADALTRQTATNTASALKTAAGSSAFGTYAAGVRQLRAALTATHSAWTPSAATSARKRLADALASLHARRLLVDARIAQIDSLVAAPSMPAVAHQRWAAHRDVLVAAVSRIDAAVQSASDQLAGPSKKSAIPAFADLADLIAAESQASAPPTYAAATLPLYRPHLAARDPATSPAITPSYADAVGDVTPVAADYAATPDAPLSQAILDKAQSLDHDYTRIFDFVRSQVRTQWYAGAQKGAESTLRTLAGSDVDQASLLIALLRASGAPARYVRGVVDVPMADLISMLGVREDEVGLALSAAGVPNRAVVAAGRISGFAIEQVYVSAYLPFADYRGTAADLDGRAWLPLMPAIKPHAFVAAAGAMASAGVVADDFVTQYLASTQTRTPLDLLRQQVSDKLSALSPPLAYTDQLARLAVNAPPIELLPASTPVAVEAVMAEFAQLPESLRQHAHIVVRAGSNAGDPVVFDRVFALQQLIDHRVSLAYQPASVDDGRIADQHGGFGTTPPYLVHVRPILNIAALPAAAGTGEVENGATQRVEITLDSPAGTSSLAQNVTAGGIAALVFDAQDNAPPEQANNVVLPGESESEAARLLSNFGARYLSTWDQADDELGRLLGVSVMRPFPSVALVINQYRLDRVGGVADALVWRGVGLDAALRPVEPYTQTAANGAAADWMQLASLQGSVLEHQLFEQQWSVDSISADKGLALAQAAGNPVLSLNQSSGTSGLNQPQPVIDAIGAWLARGYVVDVPRDPITYEDWSGAVWRVRSLSSGESGYFISGALAGGSTAMPPELWYFQDLAALLANPYSENPDTDPMSGVALSIDASAQYQDGVVNTTLAKPLSATVIDASGRPVQGAQVVFTLTNGTAKLLDAAGAETTQVVSATDRHGVASAQLRMGKSLGNFGSYRVDPNETYPQFVGFNQVEVSATADVGVLYAGQPYIAFSLPDVPTQITFLGSSDIKLSPGISYVPSWVDVTDQYDNEVSNVPISLNAATNYTPNSCNTSGTHVDTVDATLFKPGQCPNQVVQLTGNACAQSALATTSQPGGAPFFVVPPATALAQVSIAGSAASATGTLNLSTEDALFGSCYVDKIYSVPLWVYSPSFGYTPLLDYYATVLDAAPPGEVMPAPQRVDAFQGDVIHGDHAGIIWHPVDDATFDPHLQNGSIESVRGIGGGSYLTDLRAGPDPGPVHGQVYLSWDDARVAIRGVVSKTDAPDIDFNDLTFAWSVALSAPTVTPLPVPLTPFGATDSTMRIEVKALPAEYIAAPIQIDILKDNEVIATCSTSVAKLGAYYCDISRGMLVDTSKQYSARVVINDGNPFRMESASTPITFGQVIIGGYGIVAHSTSDPQNTQNTNHAKDLGGDIADELALVQGRYPKKLKLNDSVDVPSGYTCTVGQHFGFLVSRNATVTLEFHKLDAQGNPSPIVAWTALDGVAETIGLHDVLITSVDLPLGDYSYDLKAVAADGTVENYIGSASHHTQRLDSLPLAHSFVKGVDVYSGGAVASEDDISIGGRGPGMKLTRTYASNQGDERGFFGRGWSTDLDAQVLTDNCDTRIVRGSAGQGQRFAPAGTDANGNLQFTALSGYHGTLVQTGADYDFYAKDGTRYHFGQFDRSGPRLSYIEDTNGNRVAYTYEVNQGEQHVTRIEDSAGRHIDLTYTIKDVETQEAGITIEHVFTIVSDAVGPGGLQVHYDYDANGNLIKATRSDGTSGQREHAYTYDDLGGYFITQPDGAIQYYRFGYRLKTTKNLLDNAQRSYDYALAWSAVDVGGGDIQYIPVQRVVSVTEPDDGKTDFVYDGVRGLTPVATDVTDARAHGTHYVLNRYGAATEVTDPAGTTQTDWDMTHLEPHIITDALGTVTTFAYDTAGNKTSESIVDASSTIARSWTYKSPGEFALPFIKNRVATATDGNQNLTQYHYDQRGNPIEITRGGIREQDSYDANGDHASHTDGLGKVWLWRYDANGYPREAEDPLHHVTATTFDERGRKLIQTDANAHTTKYTYDAQDRLLTTTYPAINAGTGVQTTTYDDAADKRTDKNPNGHSTISSFDTMGRLIRVQRADGHSRTLQYDKNGNLTREADFSGNITTYVYDDANRRTETHAPEGRDTIDVYDALGHVTKETVEGSDGSNARITEYEYKHPLYKRTLVRRHLGARNIDAATQYDNNGNATQITDPIGRVTTRKYDARDRMFEEDAPYGRVTKTLFDNADRAFTQTVENPGRADQVTHNEYDDAGRLIATIDAVNDRRSIGYDNTKNVTSRSDARGNLTHYIYNARDELTSETGPEAGQVTSYTYDLGGNRITENWSNGNTRTSTYDVLERRTATTDSVGTIESFTYTPDDKIATRTDANGHKTTNHYDGLQRLYQQDLPTVVAGARQIVKDYDVHDDVLSETDAGQHTTSHTYDNLGRLKTTTLPDVDGDSATLQFSYDDVDRPTEKTDARGNVTTIGYDDSAHTKTQTDPTTPDGSFRQIWTYDALGNEIAHTDRRGIATRTEYDAANRVHRILRDGLTTSTRSYEDGRVKTDTDALGRVTTNVYDKAGRRTEEDRPLGAKRTWTYWPIGDVHTATDEDGRITVSTYTPRRYLESTSLAGETTTYAYDGEGHRTSMQRPLGDAYTWLYVYDAGDRLSSVTDPLGNETSYAYDLDGNLITQTNANSHATSLTYDARHRRTSQTWPTTTADSAVEHWTYDADGNLSTQITPNGKTLTYTVDALNRTTSESVSSPAASEIASTTWHHDGNGNVTGIDETL
ncbi:MAG TPA: DUF6531 domain-containing protein, partial [Rudaea sp.]|nr:DUF6531 domain-containing protein [Rudaea sp.]